MAENRYTGGEIILKALSDQDVDVVFGYPGGVTLPLYDKIYLQNKIRHILVGHEQGGVHAAEGYARSTGRPGVVLATSGPGATNTVTGLVDAMMDSIPIVCLTGQVVSNLIGNDAFQEADTTGITRAATKHNYLVQSTDDLARVMHEAFYVATHGRPGPVLVDIPKDIILGEGQYLIPEDVKPRNYNPKLKGERDKIEAAVDLLASAKKPIIYVGGGVINAGPEASEMVTKLVRMTGFPCTTTLMALGAFPASDPQFIGMPGMHGTYEANMVMHDCDMMFNIGARFDDRVTGKVDAFSPNSKARAVPMAWATSPRAKPRTRSSRTRSSRNTGPATRAPTMPVMATAPAARDTRPPVLLTTSTAIGVVIDLGAREPTTCSGAPSHQARPMAMPAARAAPTRVVISTGRHTWRTVRSCRYRGQARATVAGPSRNERMLVCCRYSS